VFERLLEDLGFQRLLAEQSLQKRSSTASSTARYRVKRIVVKPGKP
jgi:hypothetical protein